MKIDFLKSTVVGEIKRKFSAAYPYLKLEFYKSRTGRIARDKDILSKVQPSMREGRIKINETMKVKDLEDVFDSDFLLNVQVFRQSGNMWLETTATDNWV